MKHKLTKLLSLALALAMLFALSPSAFADGDENGESEQTQEEQSNQETNEDEEEESTSQSFAPDIEASSSRQDGLLKFSDEVSIKIGATTTTTSVAEAIAQACRETTGLELNYVSYLLIRDSAQGTLYDGYNSEGDTGSGVAGLDKYYYSDSVSNNRLENIQFVPKVSFTGRALISYYGYTVGAVPKIFSGTLYIVVSKQVPGISYSTDGEAVTFSREDFASYTRAVTGRSFQYVSFELPDRFEGKLYYNYIDKDIYEADVAARNRYYYSKKPYVSRVSFVPKEDFVGDVVIGFSGVDSAERSFNGQLTITVTGNGPDHTPRADGPFVYSVRSGRSVSLNSADFINQTLAQLGDTFSSFRLTSLPSSGSGVIYDDGNPSGADHYAAAGQSYSTPENIRFAAAKGFTGVVSVPMVVTGTDGEWFDSMLRFDVTKGDEGDAPLHYTVEPEKRVRLIGTDFADACYDATGYDIERVHFDSLPTASLGALYLNGSEPVDANPSTFYDKDQLSALSFLASTDFTGSLSIPFTGYATGHSDSNDRSFTGTITIASTVSDEQKTIGGTPGTLSYSTTGPAVKLDQRGILDAATPALPGSPATIVFNRPDTDAGRLCLDFVSLSRYTEFRPSATYSISDISRISFLPKAGFSGTTRISYMVRDAKGNSYGGNLTVTVTPPTRSQYFADMGTVEWAVPAVDFFRYYGTVNGATRTSFAPNASMRRADFLLLLTRAFALPDVGTASFSDVAADKYYAGAVASAKAAGIVTGSASDAFNPEGAITREDAMLYLYRALRQAGSVDPGTAADLAAFRDSANVSAGAVEALGALVRLGVLQGDNDQLRPERTLNRAETIVILYRALT